MKRLIVFASALSLAAGCVTAPQPKKESPSLRRAIGAAQWIRSTAIDSPAGRIWPDDALDATGIRSDLSTGVAGKIVFFLSLHAADPAQGALADARLGADYLIAAIPAALPGEGFPPASSLYYGAPGAAYALHRVYLATNDRKYLDGALSYTDLIHRAARPAGKGVEWSAFNEVLFGNAGTGLFLLYAAKEMQHAPSAEIAVRVGRRLLELAVEDKGGLKWMMRSTGDTNLPNFSHGTAGIAYFLATLAMQTGEREFLDAALRGAAYLDAIADTSGGGYLVPYGWPNPQWTNYHDIGWAHGPAGTARLFERLAVATGDSQWRSRVRAAARVVETSGAPGTPRERFGNEPFKLDMRFGVGSLADFLLRTGQREAAVPLLAAVEAASVTDARGTRWPMKRYSFAEKPGADAEYTGYHYGAAGYGMLFLQAHATESGAPAPLRLPDDPF